MFGRPALGRTVFSAGAERDDRLVKVQIQTGEGVRAVSLNDLQRRLWQWVQQLLAGSLSQRRKSFGHRRQRTLVEVTAIVKNPATFFAAKTGAQRDAGKPRNQRGFKRIGKHECMIKLFARETFSQAPSRGKLQRAVSERKFNDCFNFAHARIDRHHPFGCKHGNVCVVGVSLKPHQ